MSTAVPEGVSPAAQPGWVESRLVPILASGLIRTLRCTLRLRYHNRRVIEQFAAQNQRYVHVFWHAHLLLGVYTYIGPKLVFMISRSRDGEMIARTVERFGYVPSRGSSSRGGTGALKEMFRSVRLGRDIGFTPDGPKGPSRKVQPGCIAAARHLGIPLVPVAMGASRAWYLRSWDRFVVPKPGARVLFAYGEPVWVTAEETIEAGTARLEAAMQELEQFATTHAGDAAVGVSR